MFRKTLRAKQIFECMEMIQSNYGHYANLHGFVEIVFRNDYALTMALRIVNGHLDDPSCFIPWNLVHAGKSVRVFNETEDPFNTKYMLMTDHWKRGKIRKEYINLRDTDFHCINKDAFMELIA